MLGNFNDYKHESEVKHLSSSRRLINRESDSSGERT